MYHARLSLQGVARAAGTRGRRRAR